MEGLKHPGNFLAINQAQVSTIAPLGKLELGYWTQVISILQILLQNQILLVTQLSPSFPVSSDTDIHPTSIVNALGSNSVSIQTGSGSYDLTVSSPISYTGSNDLTLEAGSGCYY